MKKFFISSTFYDMHAERDMIQNIVQRKHPTKYILTN